MHRHPDACDCCTFCGHPHGRHRPRGACRIPACPCVGWGVQLRLDPQDPRDAAFLAELAERELLEVTE